MLVLFLAVGFSLAAADIRSRATPLGWAVGDFDGDHRADWVSATASREGYDLVFHSDQRPRWNQLSRGVFQMQRLAISDIDGDDDADLVLETFSSQPLAVWVNDGKGNFARGELKDYPALQLSRDPKRCSADQPPSGPEPTYEEAGSFVLVPGGRDLSPELATSLLVSLDETPCAFHASRGIGARGPPSPSSDLYPL